MVRWELARSGLPRTRSLFREVNERVAELASQYVGSEPGNAVDFTCECGRAECSETMMMTIVEYEAIRAHATRSGSSRALTAPAPGIADT